MDALAIILHAVRDTVQRTGVPPDALQQALEDAERRCRSLLGGGAHIISRQPADTLKARIIGHAECGRSVAEIAALTGATDRYVRQVLATGGVQRVTRKARIIQLSAAGVDPDQIAEELATTSRYVGRVIGGLRE